MQTKPTLKALPCPFCGKNPRVGPEEPETEGTAFGYVSCVNTKCPAHPQVLDGETNADDRGPGAYKDVAIMRWNRRAR